MALFGKKKPEAETTQAPMMVQRECLSYQIANLQGIGSREQQEDAFAFANATDVTKIQQHGLFAVVADGMGGLSGGKLASETAVAALRDSFLQMDVFASIPDHLCRSLLEASARVYEVLGGKGGSTAIACVFFNEKLYYASMGDSMLFIKRNGQLFQLNTEHNVYHSRLIQKFRCGDLSHWEESEIDQAAAVTSFLGMPNPEDIDCFKRALPLKDGDVIMLCSDGVCTLSNACILECLCEDSAQKMCEKLEQNIIAAGKRYQDNYTALVIKCEY